MSLNFERPIFLFESWRSREVGTSYHEKQISVAKLVVLQDNRLHSFHQRLIRPIYAARFLLIQKILDRDPRIGILTVPKKMKKILTNPDNRFQALFSKNFGLNYQEPIWQHLAGGKMSDWKKNEFLFILKIVPINIS